MGNMDTDRCLVCWVFNGALLCACRAQSIVILAWLLFSFLLFLLLPLLYVLLLSPSSFVIMGVAWARSGLRAEKRALTLDDDVLDRRGGDGD